jgi:hypothetical protein
MLIILNIKKEVNMRNLSFAGASLSLALAAGLSFAPSAFAAVEKTDGFVCPVIKTENVLNSPRGGTLGDTGHYTIGGPDVSVPVHATNADGAGVPAGPHSAPGDSDYTAVWASR